jgi:uncharacterized RDD family membrane protein YckC
MDGELRMNKASVWRRLGALLYDTLASIALLMFTTACWLPFYGGQAVPPGTLAYQASLLIVLYLYFAYCWHRGQTLGMRAWKLFIYDVSGRPVSLKQTIIRFITAPIGVVTMLIGWPLHDIWSKTMLGRKE